MYTQESIVYDVKYIKKCNGDKEKIYVYRSIERNRRAKVTEYISTTKMRNKNIGDLNIAGYFTSYQDPRGTARRFVSHSRLAQTATTRLVRSRIVEVLRAVPVSAGQQHYIRAPAVSTDHCPSGGYVLCDNPASRQGKIVELAVARTTSIRR